MRWRNGTCTGPPILSRLTVRLKPSKQTGLVDSRLGCKSRLDGYQLDKVEI
jgi:hypothetical protein